MSRKPVVPYTEGYQFLVTLGKEQFEVLTFAGISEWNLVLPSAQLLVEHSIIKSTDSVLLYGCYQGALAVYLSHSLPNGQLWITDYNYTALEITQMTLANNDVPLESVNILNSNELPQELFQRCNTILLQLPKGRLLARRWLTQAYNALINGGNLYIAGANNSGIQSVIKDAQVLFGNGRILGYKKGNRVAQFIKEPDAVPLPDWAQTPGIAPGTWVEFSIPFSDCVIHIRSLPGVFSYDHLDEGTKILLSVTHIPLGANVLDVGCGYGIIGLYAALHGANMVHLIDNNLLAVAASEATIALNRVRNASVLPVGLLFPSGLNQYDLILSNPPFHTGHAVNYQIAQSLIKQAYQVLNPGGQMIIVANRFIRYDRWIKEIFGNISILAESGKFHVLSGLKSS